MLRLEVAVFKIENSRDVFEVALLTSHLTANPADANLLIDLSEWWVDLYFHLGCLPSSNSEEIWGAKKI